MASGPITSWEVDGETVEIVSDFILEGGVASKITAVTIYNDFGAPKIKSVTVSTVSPSICYEVMGPDAMILVF